MRLRRLRLVTVKTFLVIPTDKVIQRRDGEADLKFLRQPLGGSLIDSVFFFYLF